MNTAQFRQVLQEPPPPLRSQVLGWPYLGWHTEVILFAVQLSIIFLVEDEVCITFPEADSSHQLGMLWQIIHRFESFGL